MIAARVQIIYNIAKMKINKRNYLFIIIIIFIYLIVMYFHPFI